MCHIISASVCYCSYTMHDINASHACIKLIMSLNLKGFAQVHWQSYGYMYAWLVLSKRDINLNKIKHYSHNSEQAAKLW